MVMGQKQPVPPVNIPIPTKIGSNMGGELTYQPKWDPKTVLTTTALKFVPAIHSFRDPVCPSAGVVPRGPGAPGSLRGAPRRPRRRSRRAAAAGAAAAPDAGGRTFGHGVGLFRSCVFWLGRKTKKGNQKVFVHVFGLGKPTGTRLLGVCEGKGKAIWDASFTYLARSCQLRKRKKNGILSPA